MRKEVNIQELKHSSLDASPLPSAQHSAPKLALLEHAADEGQLLVGDQAAQEGGQVLC
jgi:hypothetical protein